jgi:hypothetical protein
MRQAIRRKGGGVASQDGGARVSTPYPRTPPTKGWVTNQNIAAMDEKAAVILDNWFPEAEDIRLRRGSFEFAALPSADPVRTIAVYESGGITAVFAGQGEYIYDVTAGGAITTPAVTGQNSDYYIGLNFATIAGGSVLYLVNGVDDPQYYDGSVWTSPTITGATASTFGYVFAYKYRLFFIENGTADVWFLEEDQIQGEVKRLALGGLLKLGGTIVAGASMMVDSGFGPDDYCIFISSEGEVIAYNGTNPGIAESWSLRGVFRISRPIGNRCLLQIGSDIAVLCADGVISLTRSFQLDLAASDKGSFSANIREAFSEQYALTGSLRGWQLLSWPAAHMAVVNVPTTLDVASQQYVMNVLTGAWSRYTGMSASSFGLAQNTLYYGSTDGKVVIFERGNNDRGEDINAVAIPAFSNMKMAGQIKHVKNYQSFFKGSGSYSVGMNIAVDFNTNDVAVTTQTPPLGSGSLWDSALWDVATWATPNDVFVSWLGVAGQGYYLAPVILATSTDDGSGADSNCHFLALNMLYEGGAVIG